MTEPMTDYGNIEAQLRDIEALVLDALRKLSEVGDSNALRTSPDDIARHEEALTQFGRAQEQFEQLTRLVDATLFGATRH